MNTFIATTGNGLEIARLADRTWRVERHLEGVRVCCVAPANERLVFAGAANGGVLRSEDGGRTWTPSGLNALTIKALAVSAAHPTLVVAGTKPAGLFISNDTGLTWHECNAFRRIPWRRTWFSPAEWPPIGYVQAIALSSASPNVINAGIEAGGVMHSDDGGGTWTKAKGAIFDCHSLAAHPTDGQRFYQSGAGFGGAVAMSSDGGRSWRKLPSGSKLNYGWAVAADPGDPEVCHYSAAKGPMAAHGEGKARAMVFRAVGSLVEAASSPFSDMPYALIAEPGGTLVAGLSNGTVWRREGDGVWREMPFQFSRVSRAMVALE